MERSKNQEAEVGSIVQEPLVANQTANLASHHVDGGHDVLTLRLSLVLFGFSKQRPHEELVLLGQLLLEPELFLELLLVETGLELVFVLERVSFDLFLSSETVFVALS